jgi:uncharacterized protein YycO
MKKNNLLLFIPFLLFACGSEKEKSEKENVSSETKEISSDTIKSEENLVKAENDTNFVTGDVILQTSFGHQSDLVTLVTQSPFSHCGIIINQNGNKFVLEASGTVQRTPLKQWIADGKDSKYIVMRIKNMQILNDNQTSEKGKKVMQKYLGRPYDILFSWTDDKLYCSELVWKIYNETADLELCPLKKLKEYDLTDDAVKKELTKRYGNKIPLEELMVSPADIAASNQLEMIYSNY